MFDVFGKKKPEQSQDFDEDILREREAILEKSEALVYLADSVKKFTDDLSKQQKSVSDALKSLEGALLTETDKNTVYIDPEALKSSLEKFDVDTFKLSKVKEEIETMVKELTEKLCSVDTAMPAAPEEISMKDIKKELIDIKIAQTRILDIVEGLKPIASRGDVLALTATIESSKIGDAAIPIAYVAGDLRGIVADIREVYDRVNEASEKTKEQNDKIEKLITDTFKDASGKTEAFATATRDKMKAIDTVIKESSDKVKTLSATGGVIDGAIDSIRHKAEGNSEVIEKEITRIKDNLTQVERSREDLEALKRKVKSTIDACSTDAEVFERIEDLLTQIKPIVEGE